MILSVRNSDDVTSHQAARARVGLSTTQREAVLAFAQKQGDEGFIRSDVDRALGLAPHVSSPRIGELLRLGLVVKTARIRQGATGHNQRVLVVKAP